MSASPQPNPQTPALVIRPSIKFVRIGYIAAFLAVVAITAVAAYFLPSREAALIAAVSLLVLMWPAARHIRRQSTRVALEGDKLHYQTGLLSRSSRIIQLSKVQDVRVDQTFAQRLWNVGNLSIETAGESSRLVLVNVDHPTEMAAHLLDLSRHYGRY